MSNFHHTHIQSLANNQISTIDKTCEQTGEKPFVWVGQIEKLNIGQKENSELFLQNQIQPLRSYKQSQRQTISKKSTQILNQIRGLQTLVAEKSLSDCLFRNKFTQLTTKISSQNRQRKKNTEKQGLFSFRLKDKLNTQALKEILLTLCHDSELQPKSKSFLKQEIQDYFLKVQSIQQTQFGDPKQTRQYYLQKFINHIADLRSQIQSLSQQNQNLIQQNKEFSKRLLNNREESNFQNPELIFDKNFKHHPDIYQLDRCETCFKFSENNKLLAFKIARLEQSVLKKDSIIREMNEQFSKEIFKYNKVFQKLSRQKDELKAYIDEDLEVLIEDLEEQIAYLKSPERYETFELHLKRPTEFRQRQSHSHFQGPKFSQNIPTSQYLNSNVFSNCSVQKNCSENLKSRIRSKFYERPKQRSQSKYSQNSRTHSHKSYSPKYQKAYLNQMFK